MPNRKSVSGYEEGKDPATRESPVRHRRNAEEVESMPAELAEAAQADAERRAREETERRTLGES